MKNINKFAIVLLCLSIPPIVNAQTNHMNDEAAIRARMDSFATAFATGDIDAIMKNYVPDSSFVLFDIVPRKEYQGANAYRKAWTEMFTHFKSQPTIEVTELHITVDGNVAFGHSFQHLRGTDTHGRPVDRWVRVTDGYRKINGTWLIAHEHISTPVDFSTGKLVPLTKP